MIDPAAPEALAAGLLAGQRRALARAITMIESSRGDHRHRAEELMRRALPHTGRAIRLGISGIPGVGKSTFIEAFGGHLIDRGLRVAVLAVDPSSPVTGGSILGDKTRMAELARRPEAFIRPSPSGGTLGGVARRTRESLLLCEAAGHDVIIVETVGVGQSETAVAEMVDMFLLLLAPGGGDELQGIKKGIVELADLIVVNKADGDLAPAAERARREYTNALHLLRPTSPSWSPAVLKCSSLGGTGIEEVWTKVEEFRGIKTDNGELAARRAAQARAWMWGEVRETLVAMLRDSDGMGDVVHGLEGRVSRGEISPTEAARTAIAAFVDRNRPA
ncbi:MAG: methylmalonyl Co-A mutase-associated GTPase MeaB [Hyphomicrobiales bacterium]|nr:methylmalonyl Co-A mutase-associated GTPase MeaB [Hyphomicrobiales bacterium]